MRQRTALLSPSRDSLALAGETCNLVRRHQRTRLQQVNQSARRTPVAARRDRAEPSTSSAKT